MKKHRRQSHKSVFRGQLLNSAKTNYVNLTILNFNATEIVRLRWQDPWVAVKKSFVYDYKVKKFCNGHVDDEKSFRLKLYRDSSIDEVALYLRLYNLRLARASQHC